MSRGRLTRVIVPSYGRYEFLGTLFAIALLQKETVLSLNICSVFWKQLVQQQADDSDLAAFDEMVCHSLKKIEKIDEEARMHACMRSSAIADVYS